MRASTANMDTDKTDDDLSHNVTRTPLNDSSVHWMCLDHNVSLEKHKRPIFEVGEILNGNIRARVMPPNRIEKITRDDSALPGRVRSLPSRLFSRNICYQQKVQPIGTAKGRRRFDQEPLRGRSKSVHDISTELESASALEREADVSFLKSSMTFFPSEEIVMTASNVTTKAVDLDKLNGNQNDSHAVAKEIQCVEEEIIVPTVCHLCYEVRAEPVDSERNTSGLNSPSSLSRSDSVSSISSSSCRERSSAQSKAEVINEIIKALSSVSFEGSSDFKPTDTLSSGEKRLDVTMGDHERNSERNGNLLEVTTLTAVAPADPSVGSKRAKGEETLAPPVNGTRETSETKVLTDKVRGKSQAGAPKKLVPPKSLQLSSSPPSEMTQSLHRAPLKMKRASPVEALKMSWSCNDLNLSHSNLKRKVIPEVSGPLFKDSQSQTMFRVEPIGVLWEMASHFPSRTVPLFIECRPGQRTNIFKQFKRRPRGGSLEDNTMDYSSEDSMPDTTDKGVGPDETLEDVTLNDENDANTEAGALKPEVASISRSRSEERGIAWEILLNSAQPRHHMTLQQAFDAHCKGVKKRSRSRLEKVAHIKTQRYDRDKIFEQYVNLLPAHQKLKIDKDKILLDANGNRQPLQRKKQKSRKQNSLEKRKRTNRIAADIYKNRIRYEVLAGKTTFPVNKILLC